MSRQGSAYEDGEIAESSSQQSPPSGAAVTSEQYGRYSSKFIGRGERWKGHSDTSGRMSGPPLPPKMARSTSRDLSHSYSSIDSRDRYDISRGEYYHGGGYYGNSGPNEYYGSGYPPPAGMGPPNSEYYYGESHGSSTYYDSKVRGGSSGNGRPPPRESHVNRFGRPYISSRDSVQMSVTPHLSRAVTTGAIGINVNGFGGQGGENRESTSHPSSSSSRPSRWDNKSSNQSSATANTAHGGKDVKYANANASVSTGGESMKSSPLMETAQDGSRVLGPNDSKDSAPLTTTASGVKYTAVVPSGSSHRTGSRFSAPEQANETHKIHRPPPPPVPPTGVDSSIERPRLKRAFSDGIIDNFSSAAQLAAARHHIGSNAVTDSPATKRLKLQNQQSSAADTPSGNSINVEHSSLSSPQRRIVQKVGSTASRGKGSSMSETLALRDLGHKSGEKESNVSLLDTLSKFKSASSLQNEGDTGISSIGSPSRALSAGSARPSLSGRLSSHDSVSGALLLPSSSGVDVSEGEAQNTPVASASTGQGTNLINSVRRPRAAWGQGLLRRTSSASYKPGGVPADSEGQKIGIADNLSASIPTEKVNVTPTKGAAASSGAKEYTDVNESSSSVPVKLEAFSPAKKMESAVQNGQLSPVSDESRRPNKVSSISPNVGKSGITDGLSIEGKQQSMQDDDFTLKNADEEKAVMVKEEEMKMSSDERDEDQKRSLTVNRTDIVSDGGTYEGDTANAVGVHDSIVAGLHADEEGDGRSTIIKEASKKGKDKKKPKKRNEKRDVDEGQRTNTENSVNQPVDNAAVTGLSDIDSEEERSGRSKLATEKPSLRQGRTANRGSGKLGKGSNRSNRNANTISDGASIITDSSDSNRKKIAGSASNLCLPFDGTPVSFEQLPGIQRASNQCLLRQNSVKKWQEMFLLKNAFARDTDRLRALNTIYYMAELHRSVIEQVQFRDQTSISSHNALMLLTEAGLGTIADQLLLPPSYDIAQAIDLLDQHVEVLYNLLKNIREKQYMTESVLKEQCADTEIMNKSSELELGRGLQSDGISARRTVSKNIGIEVESNNKLRIIEAHLFTTIVNNVVPPPASFQSEPSCNAGMLQQQSLNTPVNRSRSSSLAGTPSSVANTGNTISSETVTARSNRKMDRKRSNSYTVAQSLSKQMNVCQLQSQNQHTNNFTNGQSNQLELSAAPGGGAGRSENETVTSVVDAYMKQKLPAQEPSKYLTFQKNRVRMNTNKAAIINEVRKRKLLRNQAWKKMADKYISVRSYWNKHCEQLEQREEEAAVSAPETVPRLRICDSVATLGPVGAPPVPPPAATVNTTRRPTINSSNTSFGVGGDGQLGFMSTAGSAGREFAGTVASRANGLGVARSDYDQEQILAQIIASELREQRIEKGLCPVPEMHSPWTEADISVPPILPLWPPNNTGPQIGAENKFEDQSEFPPFQHNFHDAIDPNCNRLTTDGKKQICEMLGLGKPCPINCNCALQYDKLQKLDRIWSDTEKCIFIDKFLQYPKNFHKIATFLTNKSTKDCVKFYYDSKSTIEFKYLLKEFDNRRRNMRAGWNYALKAAHMVGAVLYPPSEMEVKEPLIEMPTDDATCSSFLNQPPHLARQFNIPISKFYHWTNLYDEEDVGAATADKIDPPSTTASGTTLTNDILFRKGKVAPSITQPYPRPSTVSKYQRQSQLINYTFPPSSVKRVRGDEESDSEYDGNMYLRTTSKRRKKDSSSTQLDKNPFCSDYNFILRKARARDSMLPNYYFSSHHISRTFYNGVTYGTIFMDDDASETSTTGCVQQGVDLKTDSNVQIQNQQQQQLTKQNFSSAVDDAPVHTTDGSIAMGSTNGANSLVGIGNKTGVTPSKRVAPPASALIRLGIVSAHGLGAQSGDVNSSLPRSGRSGGRGTGGGRGPRRGPNSKNVGTKVENEGNDVKMSATKKQKPSGKKSIARAKVGKNSEDKIMEPKNMCGGNDEDDTGVKGSTADPASTEKKSGDQDQDVALPLLKPSTKPHDIVEEISGVATVMATAQEHAAEQEDSIDNVAGDHNTIKDENRIFFDTAEESTPSTPSPPPPPPPPSD